MLAHRLFMQAMHTTGAIGDFKPELTLKVLRRCTQCGDRHPLAYQPPSSSATCVRCGTPIVPSEKAIQVPAVLTGVYGRIATLCLWLGKLFLSWSKRI